MSLVTHKEGGCAFSTHLELFLARSSLLQVRKFTINQLHVRFWYKRGQALLQSGQL